MDLRKLRYFETAASLQNFHRAAERLNITQPALSKQIALLEESLGCQLFVREKRRVYLSPIGEIFLEDARRIIREVEFAIHRVGRAAAGKIGTLRMGFREMAGRSPKVSLVFNRFKQEYPDVELHIFQMTSNEACEALIKGEIDIGLMYSPQVQYTGLSNITVAEERPYLAMTQSHPLASKQRVKMSDLINEPFIWFSRHRSAHYVDLLMQRFISGGFSPHIVQEADSEAEMLNLISLGLGVGPVMVASEKLAPPGIRFKRVAGLNELVRLEFVWLDHGKSVLTQSFLDVVKSIVD